MSGISYGVANKHGLQAPPSWGQPSVPEIPFLQALQNYSTPTTDYGSGTNYGLGNPMGGVPALDYMGGGTGLMASAQNMPVNLGNSAGGGGFGDWFKSTGILGSTDTKTGIKTDGWGGLALGAASGLMQGYMGMKQYGLAKESLAEGKRQFQLNYDAQKTLTNSTLEDRQRSRIAANPKYESVGAYMDKNGIR